MRYVKYNLLSMFDAASDTLNEVNVPYLAIAAKVDIPAGTEITIDYSPHEERGVPGLVNGRGGEGWMPIVIPEDKEQCFCGSEYCRGFI